MLNEHCVPCVYYSPKNNISLAYAILGYEREKQWLTFYEPISLI